MIRCFGVIRACRNETAELVKYFVSLSSWPISLSLWILKAPSRLHAILQNMRAVLHVAAFLFCICCCRHKVDSLCGVREPSKSPSQSRVELCINLKKHNLFVREPRLRQRLTALTWRLRWVSPPSVLLLELEREPGTFSELHQVPSLRNPSHLPHSYREESRRRLGLVVVSQRSVLNSQQTVCQSWY